jgi:Flp pilus assembly protein TadD
MQDIMLTLQEGRSAEAERLSRLALEQQPDNQDLLLYLAISLHQQKKMAEAVEAYAKLTRLCPQSGVHWGNYATALRDSGDLEQAEQAYGTSLRLEPGNAGQLMNLGLLLLDRHDYIQAREKLLDAFEIDPESPLTRIHAARACSACRDDHRVEELLKPWREWTSLEPELQLELARLQLALGDANLVRLLLEELLRGMPTYLPAKLLLASVYERINQLDRAEMMLVEITSGPYEIDQPARLEIQHQYATLAFRKGNLSEARTLLERAGARHEGDYAHYFLLGSICDKLGDLPAALQVFQTAHQRQVQEMQLVVPYRVDPDAPVLPSAVGRVTGSDYRRWPKLIAPEAEYSPVFIVGFPRSGTTLLEQMLDAHPTLQSMDERPFFNILVDKLALKGFRFPQDIEKLDQADCDELRKAYVSMVCSKVSRKWDTRLVDKNPMNMLWLPMIHRLYPNASYILALRHPCDVLISNYMQNFRSTVLASACASIERLATAYVTAMECWLDHVRVLEPKIFVSKYEDLVADTPGQTQRIAQFLGLGDASSMLRFDQHAREKGYIATPSYTQVIQPVNRKGLNRWLRYRDALAPALPILQPMLDHWRYSTDDIP